jgi:hypothetical protein
MGLILFTNPDRKSGYVLGYYQPSPSGLVSTAKSRALLKQMHITAARCSQNTSCDIS